MIFDSSITGPLSFRAASAAISDKGILESSDETSCLTSSSLITGRCSIDLMEFSSSPRWSFMAFVLSAIIPSTVASSSVGVWSSCKKSDSWEATISFTVSSLMVGFLSSS